jgi:hypothetical protein
MVMMVMELSEPMQKKHGLFSSRLLMFDDINRGDNARKRFLRFQLDSTRPTENA